MNRLLVAASLVLLSGLSLAAEVAVTGGSARMSSAQYHSETSVAIVVVGHSRNSTYDHYIGHIGVSKARFARFIGGGFPNKVVVQPGSQSGTRFVKAVTRSMDLAWTDGTVSVPVDYEVSMGETATSLSIVTSQSGRTFPTSNLTFGTDYFWQVRAFDVYGRSTYSDVFTFSIVPDVRHMYSAPNPFRAGSENTRFIFYASHEGATFQVYSLPHGDLVLSRRIDNLVDGVNTWEYDGRDGKGAILFNGVYMAVLESKGYETEKFKFVVAK